MATPGQQVALALARQAARKAAGEIVDGIIEGIVGKKPSTDVREQLIDTLILGGTVASVRAAIAVTLPAQATPLASTEEQPNVLWDYVGIYQGMNRTIVELGKLLSGQFPVDVEKAVISGISQMNNGWDSTFRRRIPRLWRYWVPYCLPQWSKGRKDQPDNPRLQRPNPRFAEGKQHRSPLGEDW